MDLGSLKSIFATACITKSKVNIPSSKKQNLPNSQISCEFQGSASRLVFLTFREIFNVLKFWYQEKN